MDTLIILLGVFGFGAIIIAVHAFVADAGSLVSEVPAGDDFGERKGHDRRGGTQVMFPLMINDTLVREDRRALPDRRRAAT